MGRLFQRFPLGQNSRHEHPRATLTLNAASHNTDGSPADRWIQVKCEVEQRWGKVVYSFPAIGVQDKKQFASVIVAGIVLLFLLLAWANAVEPPDDVLARILAAAVVLAVPLSVQALKKRHQGRALKQAEGSFEKEMSVLA